jgi:hypothetical protein
MKIKNSSLFIAALFSLFLLASCSDDDVTPEAGEFTIEFDSRAGDANLQLNTANTLYANAKGQTFNVTLFQYYISNIKLKREDGTYFEDPMSTDGSKGFYLIRETEPGSEEIVLTEYYAYYHATAFEDWHEWTSCVAISDDLIHWKKGVPHYHPLWNRRYKGVVCQLIHRTLTSYAF